MLEDLTDEEDGSIVVVDHPVVVGEAVRPAGGDVAVGDVVADPGTVVTPAHVGVFANLGMATVVVHARPRVGVLSTGDELAPDPGPLGPGQIRDANRHALLALVAREGGIRSTSGWSAMTRSRWAAPSTGPRTAATPS